MKRLTLSIMLALGACSTPTKTETAPAKEPGVIPITRGPSIRFECKFAKGDMITLTFPSGDTCNGEIIEVTFIGDGVQHYDVVYMVQAGDVMTIGSFTGVPETAISPR